ncbi:SDR family NAD(P)-dependent oxidoreductase [Sphingobium fuliginis]|uniref:Uncharacterized protein n=1 Tax=Sphingobium fuliginis (strain ATCC 27551) TaxID=336203 RepID=A0A292ZE41_SPHSA|nr:SDR family NAD(P)-dependent oxidoreductase [Sphingobium fuliginis]GAY21747.1 hypothetical protein SFOMI_2300 [Sphingobium fuliginis]
MEAGAIVNIAISLGQVRCPVRAYVASKHGVIGLTRGAAVDYAARTRMNTDPAGRDAGVYTRHGLVSGDEDGAHTRFDPYEQDGTE